MVDRELYPKIFQNLFSVLSVDKHLQLNKRKSINRASNELQIGQETLKQYYNRWKDSGQSVFSFTSPALNLEMAAAILTILIGEPKLSDKSQQRLQELLFKLAPRFHLPAFLDRITNYLTVKDWTSRFQLIYAELRGEVKTTGHTDTQDPLYIANQIVYEGFDELQRLLLAYRLGNHVAIDGPPGVGKTRTVIEIGKILQIPLFTKTCSSRTTESHIISFPVLTVEDGVSVTAQINGPLLKAMETPGIFYGDEFNLLKEDVQKRMNSAFDERAAIDRVDGVVVQARSGFWAVISYNPTDNMLARDLEDSVADRFIHLNFHRWTPDFKAFVASSRSTNNPTEFKPEILQKEFGIELELRGFSKELKFCRKNKQDGKWLNFFSGKECNPPPYIYYAYDSNSIFKENDTKTQQTIQEFDRQAFSEHEFARMIARFTDLLQSLARTGEAPLLNRIGLSELAEKEDLELLTIHESSARIEISALRTYRELLRMGCGKYLAQSYATRLIIDQICYGQYRNKRLKDSTVYSLVNQIARSMRLFADNSRYNTRMVTENLLAS